MPVRLVTGGARSAVFPALFDPGTNHNMAIREQHVRDWTGFALRKLGAIKINGVVDERSLAFRFFCRARSDAIEASSSSMPTRGCLPRIKHG
ncbi:MAG TPA: hypothetical protein VFI31_01055 [Pirellulales bacterium]|nr:hypothetical protein [Pirellulales bacterium]